MYIASEKNRGMVYIVLANDINDAWEKLTHIEFRMNWEKYIDDVKKNFTMTEISLKDNEYVSIYSTTDDDEPSDIEINLYT